LRHPNRKEAPAFKAELKSIAGGADLIARGLDAYRAGLDRPAQVLALHHLLERQHTSSGIGDWRPATSTIGASSTSMRWPDCVSRIPARSTPSIAGQKADRGKRLQGLRLDHIDGLRDPAHIFSACAA